MLQAAKRVAASRVSKTKTSAAKGVAPAENRRNSNRIPGVNQAQITAERLRFADEEEAERNKDPNANKDTDRDDEQSGTQSEDDNPSDDSSEEKTLEELVARQKLHA
jgi:hypothetical protein